MQPILLNTLERYAYADLAAGKDARHRKKTARQCIVVGARDWFNRWFWLYIWAGRLSASEFKDRILQKQEEYEPRRFGLEANGMQVMFGSLVREDAKERFGTSVKMIPIYQPTNVEKNYRIRTGLEPAILQGRFFLRTNEVDARAELQGFPTAQTKDIVDAMETCMNRVAPKRYIKAAEEHEKDEYAQYLRSTGMPAHLIEKQMMKFSVSRASSMQ